MAITVVFDPPLPTDPPATFDSKAFTLLGDLNDFASEANALQVDVNAKESTATAAAATATTKAGEALTSANNAASSASAAAGSAAAAAGSAAAADASADAAAASAAAAATFDPSNYLQKGELIKRFSTGAALPSLDIGPIWHEDYAAVMTWRTIGSYTGYASVNLGEVAYFDAQTAPAGWLKSAGQTLSAAYAALNAYRGSSTLRDLRAEFIRGWDDGRGSDSGRVFGSYQADQFQGHEHTQVQGGTLSTAANSAGAFIVGNQNTSTTLGVANSPTYGTARVGLETRPRNIALLACIKF